MQNKGFVKVIAVLLTLICVYYLSFAVYTNYIDGKADKMKEEIGGEKGEKAAQAYLDSLNQEKCYLGNTLKECRENAIGLGLDLKGGMNVMLEVSVPDVVKVLSDNNQSTEFLDAMKEAQKESQQSQSDFITLFVEKYKKLSNGKSLAAVFANSKMGEKVKTNSSDSDVEKAIRAEVDDAVDNAFKVLRARIDRFGVVQPNIQKIEGQVGRISVELPGIKEPERVRKLLQGSANLEFWETYDTQVALPYLIQLNNALRGGSDADNSEETAQATDSLNTEAAPDSTSLAKNEAQADTASADTASKKGDLLSNVSATPTDADANAKLSDEEIEKMKKENPLLSMLHPQQGNAGCVVGYALATDTAEINTLINSETAKQIFPADFVLKWDVKGLKGQDNVFRLYALKKGPKGGPSMEGDVITEAHDDFDNLGHPSVSMNMNTEGARKWAALTEANVNHSVAIVLDDYVYSAPNVNDKIEGGRSQITGDFLPSETKDLATVLASGKMPARTVIVQEDIVGPTLGQQSIKAGFISFIIAFIILMIYMCMMYGFRPGMVANGALIINFFFTLGILTSFQAALTMSGIAGMVLTLGTAVDANVLIYERIKEELRGGKGMKSAISAGYSNAFSAIFDSNLTSLITGIILFSAGTGPIKGFATTLIIGIVCSFFTAVWLTRIVYEHFVNREKWLDLTFTTSISRNMFKDTKYKFMSTYKKSFTVFAVLVAVGVVSLIVRGLSQSIDFTGGRNFKVEFAKPVDIESTRSVLQGNLVDK